MSQPHPHGVPADLTRPWATGRVPPGEVCDVTRHELGARVSQQTSRGRGLRACQVKCVTSHNMSQLHGVPDDFVVGLAGPRAALFLLHRQLNSLMSIATTVSGIVWVAKFVESEKHNPKPQHPPEQVSASALGIYITCAIYLCLYLYYFVISLLVIVGVHRNKPHLLTYYVNTVLFMLIVVAALIVVTVVFLGVIAAIPLLFFSVIVFYCLLVVRSAYLEMVEQNRPKVYEMHNISPQQAPLMA
ncbi:uncharacterized protein LOC125235522 [Leguminivora glycinivorella]|uniref:uncharacterized protein LOC125235522 n=1 Tax=Leguminivora glycinivorella TaxID=1035111 RepID=UPI00200C4089|nr:uncharacterized protein LOC125235522 [Leguminivora glycinivorella]